MRGREEAERCRLTGRDHSYRQLLLLAVLQELGSLLLSSQGEIELLQSLRH